MPCVFGIACCSCACVMLDVLCVVCYVYARVFVCRVVMCVYCLLCVVFCVVCILCCSLCVVCCVMCVTRCVCVLCIHSLCVACCLRCMIDDVVMLRAYVVWCVLSGLHCALCCCMLHVA